MTRLLTKNITTMTGLRDLQKVLDRAGGEPVAVLKKSRLLAYLISAERTEDEAGHRVATVEEVRAHLRETREQGQPVLNYLRNK